MEFRSTPKLAAVSLIVIAFAAICGLRSPAGAETAVKILFDTDMDTDCDDLGALAVLHALADLGEAEILATVVSTRNPWSAPCVDVVNTYYGRPDLPIGMPKGKGVDRPSAYAKQLAEAFPRDQEPGEAVPDALKVYRDVLSAQPDGSVVIVTVGYLTNIANLLKDPGGEDLVRAKVKRWVCMGGNFIGSPAKDDLKLGNNNFTFDSDASFHAIQNWPVELVFVGREIGSVPSGLKVGSRLREAPASNPVRRGYEHYFDGVAEDRHVADQTTVLFAVRGLRDYWSIVDKGSMDLQSNMRFTWDPEGDKPHAHLLKRKVDGKPNDREIERVIDELMRRPPRTK